MTVSASTKEDIGELIALWRTCFGDDEEYISAFMRARFVPERTLVGREDGRICSVLYLLDGKVRIAGEAFEAAYLYAVCTHPDFRSRGCMGELLRAAESLCRDLGLDYICLVPAEDSLFDYYSRFGYRSAFEEKLMTVDRRHLELIADSGAQIVRLTSDGMQTVRNACLCGIDCFVWDIDALQYAIDENANTGCKSVAASSSGRCSAYALFDEEDGTAVIRECAARRGCVPVLAYALLCASDCDSFLFRLPLDFPLSADSFTTRNNAMLLPLNADSESALKDIKNAYMGLTLG